MAIGPDNRTVREIRLYDTRQSKLIKMFQMEGPAWQSAFASGGRFLISGSRDKVLQVWDTAAGGEVARKKGTAHHMQRLDVSPDGRHVVSGGGEYVEDGKFADDGDFALRQWRLPESVWPPPLKDK